MTRDLLAQFAVIALVLAMPCCLVSSSKQEFKTKGGSRVVILPVGKLSGHGEAESRIEFYSSQNRMLCALDYSSEDSEHGFGVVKAAWTPDNNYFVFSLTSSGGHQPWHTPTLFYSVADHTIDSLESHLKVAGISKGEFFLSDPNVVLTEALQGQRSVAIKIRLGSLTRKGKSHAWRCEGGIVINPESELVRPYA